MTAPILQPATSCGSALDSPQFTAELLAAIEEGLPLEDYLTARSLGVADDELTAAFQVGFPLVGYASARTAGATCAELDELYTVVHTGPTALRPTLRRTAEVYATARQAGLSHADLSEALADSIDPGAYLTARLVGATHTQVLAIAHRTDIGLPGYVLARRHGATHAGLLQAARAGVAQELYVVALRGGVTHTEVMEVQRECISVFDYLHHRLGLGATHQGALAAQQQVLASLHPV
jgi:hypothetical protein